ncbi:hypothetical protein ACQUWZ_27675, partial [Ralstonia pseudosolanacearum]|uniref:hypothetical protein n=1 Tax=Ralstonia pseudosolanacearum TaxID=1310165 RepID=UPI003D16540C
DYRAKLDGRLPNDTLEILLDYPNLIAKLAEVDDFATKKVANWFTSVLLAEENTSLLNDDLPSKNQLEELVTMNDKNELSSTAAKEV